MSLPGVKKTGAATPAAVASSAAHPNACPHCGYLHNTYKTAVYGPDWQAQFAGNEDALYCVMCHKHYGPNPGNVEELKGVAKAIPETQKAKGIKALAGHAYALGISAIPISNLLRVDKSFLGRELLKKVLPKFARPCPPSPEHGFVESRDVNTLEELEQVRIETLAANENSEIVLMNRVKAALNVIWTPTLLAIGPGHDGATSGKGAISVPLIGTHNLDPELLTEAGIGEGKAPYIESVFGLSGSYHTNPCHYLTQLRAGPVLSSGLDPDFIPVPMKVEEVIKTNGEDLLEWAKAVKGLAGKPGIVVWHPTGVLTDHYCVHCRENNVPIVMSFEPAVGQELAAKGAIPPLDPEQVLRGLAVGDAIDMGKLDNELSEHSRWSPFIRIVLFALHHSAVLRGPHSFWIGVACAVILKTGVAALEAEARHAHSCYKGMKEKPNIYEYYTARKLSFLRARLSRVTQILHYGFGDPDTPKSYGGRKWALCGAALCPMFNSIQNLAASPTEGNASKLLLDLNIAVNQAHNGGWWLNKFVPMNMYDKWPAGNVGEMVKLSSAIWFVLEQAKEISDSRVKSFITRVSKWSLTEIKPLKFRKASLDIMPGAFVLNLKAATLPVPRTITIPATASLVKTLLAAAGEIRIERGNVSLVQPDGGVINVWSEDPLVAEARDIHRN